MVDFDLMQSLTKIGFRIESKVVCKNIEKLDKKNEKEKTKKKKRKKQNKSKKRSCNYDEDDNDDDCRDHWKEANFSWFIVSPTDSERNGLFNRISMSFLAQICDSSAAGSSKPCFQTIPRALLCYSFILFDTKKFGHFDNNVMSK